jgi:hypothetical protein
LLRLRPKCLCANLGKLAFGHLRAIDGQRLPRVYEPLNVLAPIDREVLTLQQFEQLGRAEAPLVLGISHEADIK